MLQTPGPSTISTRFGLTACCVFNYTVTIQLVSLALSTAGRVVLDLGVGPWSKLWKALWRYSVGYLYGVKVSLPTAVKQKPLWCILAATISFLYVNF